MRQAISDPACKMPIQMSIIICRLSLEVFFRSETNSTAPHGTIRMARQRRTDIEVVIVMVSKSSVISSLHAKKFQLSKKSRNTKVLSKSKK